MFHAPPAKYSTANAARINSPEITGTDQLPCHHRWNHFIRLSSSWLCFVWLERGRGGFVTGFCYRGDNVVDGSLGFVVVDFNPSGCEMHFHVVNALELSDAFFNLVHA